MNNDYWRDNYLSPENMERWDAATRSRLNALDDAIKLKNESTEWCQTAAQSLWIACALNIFVASIYFLDLATH